MMMIRLSLYHIIIVVALIFFIYVSKVALEPIDRCDLIGDVEDA